MIFHRSLLLAIVAAVALLGALPATAAEVETLQRGRLCRGAEAGQVDPCRYFCALVPCMPSAESYSRAADARAQFNNLVVFKVDFDNQKADVRALNAQQQSTLIVYKGESEKGRTVGDTDEKSITALVNSAL
jgi:thioredoxin 1